MSRESRVWVEAWKCSRMNLVSPMKEIGLEIRSLGPDSSLSPDTKEMQYTGVFGLGRRDCSQATRSEARTRVEIHM